MSMSPISLKCLYYNVRLFWRTPGPQYKEKQRLQYLIENIRNSGADIVGLSETWSDFTKRHLIGGLSEAYAYSLYEPASRTGRGSGLLLLSKFPLVDEHFFSFKQSSGLDRFAKKGFYKVKIDLPVDRGAAGAIHVFLTHAQNGKSHKATKVRSAQLAAIGKEIRITAGANLLMGDFNVVAEALDGRASGEYRHLVEMLQSEGGLIDAFRVYQDSGEDPGFTFDSVENSLARKFSKAPGFRERIDYIFVSDSISVKRARVIKDFKFPDQASPALMDLSDHFPLECELEMSAASNNARQTAPRCRPDRTVPQ